MAELKTTSIRFTSRASVKIKDSYFTFEACAEKSVPEDMTPEELVDAKQEFWDELNQEVDNQIQEVCNYAKK